MAKKLGKGKRRVPNLAPGTVNLRLGRCAVSLTRRPTVVC
jgi:hypothetical protein